MKRLRQGWTFCCSSCDALSMVMGVKGTQQMFEILAAKSKGQMSNGA